MKIRNIIIFVTGLVVGITCFTYAETYNSNDIVYDNSISLASATNVKDALDYLYENGSCREGMSCLESPTVAINVALDGYCGNVDKNTMKVPINGSNTIIVTPNSGCYIQNISCTNDYKVSEYVKEGSQEVTIINPGVVKGSECTVTFNHPDYDLKD